MDAETQYPNRYTEIPPNGKVCAFTGLKHAKLYSMLKKGGEAFSRVRVANLREPGKARGKTIFHVGDMLRFIDEKAKSEKAEAEEMAAVMEMAEAVEATA